MTAITAEHAATLENVVNMGFDRETALAALQRRNWNPEQALDDILTGNMGPSVRFDDNEISPLIDSNSDITWPDTTDRGRTHDSRAVAPGQWSPSRVSAPTPVRAQGQGTGTGEVIDLTGDENDDDLQAALRASMNDQPPPSGQPGPPPSPTVFGPSNRNDPDGKWALTAPTGGSAVQGADGQTEEDRQLSRAVEESMMSSNPNIAESAPRSDPPPPDRVRETRHPVYLRPTYPVLAPYALTIRALLTLPPVRVALFSSLVQPYESEPVHEPTYWQGIVASPDPDVPDSVQMVQRLQRLAAFVEKSHREYINPAEVFDALQVPADATWPQNLGQELNSLIDHISHLWFLAVSPAAPSEFTGPSSPPPTPSDSTNPIFQLFRTTVTRQHTSLSTSSSSSAISPSDEPSPTEIEHAPVVPLDIPFSFASERSEASVMSCLADVLWQGDRRQSVVRPAEIVCFHLRRMDSNTRFRIDEELYFDRFAWENRVHAERIDQGVKNGRVELEEIEKEIRELVRRNDRSTLADLRASIEHFSKASSPDTANADYSADPLRVQRAEKAKAQLTLVLERLEAKLADKREAVEELKYELEHAFDFPDMQKMRYRLRAVVSHNGIAGTSNMWAYIRDDAGKWWKLRDAEKPVEVTAQEALCDTNGVPLRAGPLLLFYAREREGQQDFTIPELVLNGVLLDNLDFAAQLPEPVVERLQRDFPIVPPAPGLESAREDVEMGDAQADEAEVQAAVQEREKEEPRAVGVP